MRLFWQLESEQRAWRLECVMKLSQQLIAFILAVRPEHPFPIRLRRGLRKMSSLGCLSGLTHSPREGDTLWPDVFIRLACLACLALCVHLCSFTVYKVSSNLVSFPGLRYSLVTWSAPYCGGPSARTTEIRYFLVSC